MKIFVTGTRGIPDIPGGVEKHCQELYPRIAQKGHDVFLCRRSCYVSKEICDYQGVNILTSYAPRKKSFEAIIHTFISLVKAIPYQPDLVHIHAIGPSLLIPVARLMGFKVVMTHHGPDYDRQKWGKFAKFVLRLGEKAGGCYADEVIVISSVIRKIIAEKCRRESNLICNGVPVPQKSGNTDFLTQIGTAPQKYVLAVARFVPEKGLHDLIEAFKSIDSDDKLVIAGDADHESDYSKELRQAAKTDSRIILTGYVTGEPLNQLYSHAGLFVLPSYHEGLPIVLLEAMSYGLPVLVSDIPANMEVGLSEDRYFKCGNVSDLKEKMESLLKIQLSEEERQRIRNQIAEKYNWDKIAEQTLKVYEKAIAGGRSQVAGCN